VLNVQEAPRTRVLIVDGYRAVREGLAALLMAEEDFEVVGEADNQADGLRQAIALRPDLLLLDLELPQLYGEQTLGTLARLREAGVGARVVALSMTGDSALQRQLANGDCDGYIQKGVQPQDVVRTIRAALRSD
jgi:two-component system, NarL family, nitrate/nitrite response regulator NarL